MKKTVLLFLFIYCSLFAQTSHSIMTYNLLNYPGNDTITRNPHFRTIIQNTEPDILVVQEMISQEGVNGFLNNVLNPVSTGYTAGAFINGPDTDNAIFYKSGLFSFIDNTPIKTALRDINQFRIKHIVSGDTLIIYSVHLKASSGSANQDKRAAEIDSLLKVTNLLEPGSYYILLGDFNIYSSNEPAYQKLLDLSRSGYFIDYLSLSGTWNNSAYAAYHTQSPRTRAFGGGANGGMDDRFDMILFSNSVYSSGGITFVPGSYTNYGNNGSHYNDSINHPPNTAVGQAVANALHYASDHIPVYAEFYFENAIPVELVSFTASFYNNDVLLKWRTATETNNFGFNLDRKKENGRWERIIFIPGSGNSTAPIDYSYMDKNINSGSYSYRLQQIDLDGSSAYVSTASVQSQAPDNFTLHQNYPNPFNPVTKIKFEIPDYLSMQKAVLSIYDILGNKIAVLLDEIKSPGIHEVEWDASNFPNGLYIYQLRIDEQTANNKMILLK